MGILVSALIGVGVGTAAYNYIRYQNGDVVFTLYNDYPKSSIPVIVKPYLPSVSEVPIMVERPGEVLKQINNAITKDTSFEGVNLKRFHTTEIAEEDRVQYARAVHEAHRCIRRGKRCKLYLDGDQFLLRIEHK